MKLYHKLSIENLDYILNNDEVEVCCSSSESIRLFSLGNRGVCLEIEVDDEVANDCFCSSNDFDANKYYGWDEYRYVLKNTDNYRIIMKDGLKSDIIDGECYEEHYRMIEDLYNYIIDESDSGLDEKFLNF
jgi:hypothetical protein